MWLHVCSLCPTLPVYDPLCLPSFPALLLSFPAAFADPPASHVCVALLPHPLHPSPPSPTQPTRAHLAHPPPCAAHHLPVTLPSRGLQALCTRLQRPFRVRLDNLTAVRLGGSTNVLAVYVDPDNGDRGGRAHGSGWWCEGGGL